ncbi:MAG: hypothetical protein HZB38_18750 [Planctomycetes bacterium]|nr:hypothetical protein [Planctomycetota bacterium]
MSDPNASYLPAPATSVRMRFSRPGPRAWLRVEAAATHATVLVNGRTVGTHLGAWTPFEFDISDYLEAENEAVIECEDRLHATNGFLPVLGVRWTGVVPDYSTGRTRSPAVRVLTSPTTTPPAAPQRSSVRGTQLLVDGRPFRVRGILHWGFYPELGNPWPAEAQIREEIDYLQSLGFNLIKFCLWAPPTRYLEICDELGMLVWQEYPVWNAPLGGAGTPQYQHARLSSSSLQSPDHQVLREFRELLLRDRQYPCVILRTMTCENDHVSPEMSRALVDLAHELIPGCLALDNSGWLCSEQNGDFHDEHPYVHNANWQYYGRRMRGLLRKPLLLGETIVADSLSEEQARTIVGDEQATQAVARSIEAALRVRRWQIETLRSELPDAGYVICGLRDLRNSPLGLYTCDGKRKYSAAEWAWHGAGGGETLAPLPPQAGTPGEIDEGAIQPALGSVLGPRKGAWKCSNHPYWSPNLCVLDASLPAELIFREALFELLSGRVLTHAAGTRVLVELINVHSGAMRHLPLIIEFRSAGRWHIVSAFRHGSSAGRELWHALRARIDRPDIPPPPEIGPLVGHSIVLRDWEMRHDHNLWEVHSASPAFDPDARDGQWTQICCDSPLVNGGRNIFEGWATFRTRFEAPAGRRILRCESVADYYELYLDGRFLGSAGPKHGTWDGGHDMPRDFELELDAGYHELVIRARDWRATGGMVGPVYLATDLNERIF